MFLLGKSCSSFSASYKIVFNRKVPSVSCLFLNKQHWHQKIMALLWVTTTHYRDTLSWR